VKVLLTGHDGYIGSILAPMLQTAGHEVIGLDSFLFADCGFKANVDVDRPVPALDIDVRDVEVSHLQGFDAVVHLAALSNDPLSDLDPELTFDINHRASARLARLAKQAGVPRFLFSSSCSLYGASGDELITEEAAFHPVTPYGVSKVLAEQDISKLADDCFSPAFLRNATAYGMSSKLRGDLVVNNLVGHAFTTGEVLVKSDGSPWRPLVHVEDIAQAFQTLLEAPRHLIHNQAFNVGSSDENYQIRDVASLVEDVVPRSKVSYAPGGGPDLRCYRVDCSKLRHHFPGFQPRWTVRRGIAQLYEAYHNNALTSDDLLGPRYMRIAHIRKLLSTGDLDSSLRWKVSGAQPAAI